MKKLFSLFVIFIVFTGCSTDVTTNTPGFQAFKDDVLWRAIDVKAYVSGSGHLRIVGMAQNEEVELNLSSTDVGTYYLGSTDIENTAQYTSTFNDLFLTYLTYDVDGPILNINNPIITGGTGYTQGSFITTTSSNGGSGLRVNTTVNDVGAVTAVKISSPGSNYELGDIITIDGGDNNSKFKISSEIKITNNSDGTITGSFKFTAKNALFNPVVNELVSFQYGAFYKIPLIPEP